MHSTTQTLPVAGKETPAAEFQSLTPMPARLATPLQQTTCKSIATLNLSEWVSETPAPQNIGMVRFFLFLVGLPLIAFGLLLIALAGWEIGFLFLGPLLIIAGIASLKKAFTPSSKWDEPRENPQADINAQLRQARKNQHRRRIEERQERRAAQAQVRDEAQARRRQRRQAFFQSAYTRMAIGFFGILALYAVLF